VIKTSTTKLELASAALREVALDRNIIDWDTLDSTALKDPSTPLDHVSAAVSIGMWTWEKIREGAENTPVCEENLT
jgi:hydrogenase/urease accessory protein HupE